MVAVLENVKELDEMVMYIATSVALPTISNYNL